MELPGMLEVAIRTHEQRWPHTMDAKKWAEEFMERFPEHGAVHPDLGTMIGWFANAIMAGYDTANARREREKEEK